jgi:chemotaxis protein CheD
MPLVTVGISDLEISDAADDVLVTYALGSCIGVIVHDPARKVGGMIHYMLPEASISPDKARESPAMFADTGVPLLFHGMYRAGCEKARLVVKVVGGSKLHDDGGAFDIGRRNYVAVRRMLWKAGVLIAAEHVGGAASRTAKLHVGSGRVTVRTATEEVEL